MSRCKMRSHVQGGGLWGKGTGGLYNEDQCIMGNGRMGPPSLYPSFMDRQTHTSENITFPQLRWFVVNTHKNRSTPLQVSWFYS